mmetsp:Transcript_805/g.2992  ORF Transcript_805/g.2992 Transcript_805/m.2992 type:complete len:244 (-) Transcript_805:413-1144(-)
MGRRPRGAQDFLRARHRPWRGHWRCALRARAALRGAHAQARDAGRVPKVDRARLDLHLQVCGHLRGVDRAARHLRVPLGSARRSARRQGFSRLSSQVRPPQEECRRHVPRRNSRLRAHGPRPPLPALNGLLAALPAQHHPPARDHLRKGTCLGRHGLALEPPHPTPRAPKGPSCQTPPAPALVSKNAVLVHVHQPVARPPATEQQAQLKITTEGLISTRLFAATPDCRRATGCSLRVCRGCRA